VASGGTALADAPLSGEVVVPEETRRTETTIETRERTTYDDDSAYGPPIEEPYVIAEREAFVYGRAPNKAAGVGESVGSLLFNTVFFPVRLAVGTVGAVFGGVTGAMTGGDERAAAQIWNVSSDGDYFLTPARIERRTELRVTGDHP
jgi:hypothetical protein